MGYSVPEHFKALDRLGPTIHHRRSFAPVAALYGETVVDPKWTTVAALVWRVQCRDRSRLTQLLERSESGDTALGCRPSNRQSLLYIVRTSVGH